MERTIKSLEIKIETLLEKRDSFKIAKEIELFIKEYKSSLKQSFLDRPDKGRNFLIKHSKFYDSVITLLYKSVLRLMFGNYMPLRDSIPIVIVALGSYGREELTVHSDIDLMITYRKIDGYNIEKIIERFLLMVWDSGLKLGHRTHDISEIEAVAKTDSTIKTAILESRKIMGSTFVWNALLDQLKAVRQFDQYGFIRQKEVERDKRYRTHSMGEMEPDLKDGFGGLRDWNILYWVANVIYGVDNIRELSGKLFSESELRKFSSALDFVFATRTALHLSTKKKRDRVTLDDVPYLSETLGIEQHSQFSQKLSSAMWNIHAFASKVTRKIAKSIIFKNDINQFINIKESRIARGLYVVNNELLIASEIKFKNYEEFIAFLHQIPDQNLKISESIYALLDSIETENENIISSDRKNILKLFERQYLYPVLEILLKVALIDKLLPLFEKVLHLPQFDGYHKHPVDVHSIYNIREIENIQDKKIADLYNSLADSERRILKIASLFHDIGKGRTEDHSKVGARITKQFLKDFGEENDEVIERVGNLIRHHTVMTETAYNDDIFDERVIFSFTSRLKERRDLNLLYILTYGDVRSVNEKTFNSHSGRLLSTLYQNALYSFEHREMLKESERKEKRVRQLINSEIYKIQPKNIQKAVLDIKSNFAFLQLSNEELIEIVQITKSLSGYWFKFENNEYLTLRVIRDKSLNFDIAYLLNRLNLLSVASLELFELFDGAKYFKIEFTSSIAKDDEIMLDEVIKLSFVNNNDTRKKFKKLLAKIYREELTIDCDYSNSHVRMRLQTANQNGLLAYLFKFFEDEKIDVVSTKTQTFKKSVKDTFLFNRDNSGCDKYERLIGLITGDIK